MNDNIPDAESHSTELRSRREFIRKAVYASPVLLTLPAIPSFAQQGSGGAPGNGDDPVVVDPDVGDPGTGERDCDNPFQPIESDTVQNVCHFTADPVTDVINDGDDLILSNDDVANHLAHGDGLSTCDSFFCGAS
jgi:hypothetical protein